MREVASRSLHAPPHFLVTYVTWAGSLSLISVPFGSRYVSQFLQAFLPITHPPLPEYVRYFITSEGSFSSLISHSDLTGFEHLLLVYKYRAEYLNSNRAQRTCCRSHHTLRSQCLQAVTETASRMYSASISESLRDVSVPLIRVDPDIYRRFRILYIRSAYCRCPWNLQLLLTCSYILVADWMERFILTFLVRDVDVILLSFFISSWFTDFSPSSFAK